MCETVDYANEKKLNILNLLPRGEQGGIERLCLDVARLSAENNHFYFMWGGGSVADQILEYTNQVVVRNFTYQNIVREYFVLREYVVRNDINIIILQVPSPVFLIYISWIKKRFPHIRVCAYIHADPNLIFDSRLKKIQFKLFQKYCDKNIAISKFVEKQLVRDYEIKNISVIYNGTDIDRFNIRKEKKVTNKINMVYVGRLAPEKGLNLLIEALSEVEFEFQLVIVGEGACLSDLKRLVSVIGISDYVVFSGASDSVEEFLGEADIFVHPTVCNEGFGITLIEAMAAGVPCVAFARGLYLKS